VAMLSYSTSCTGIGRDSDRVREATKIAQRLAPEIAIEGPMQYDVAIDSGKHKIPNSRVAGRATVLIFPDLNIANSTYKGLREE